MRALTNRELQVLRLIAQGHANRKIADKLGTSNYTVRSQVSYILIKLGADNRTHAVFLARKRGIL